MFIVLAATNSENANVNLAPIYSFFVSKGVKVSGEYLLVGDVPVQLLFPYDALVEEAIAEAEEVTFRATTVRIPQLEYLMAIMVQTGRAKDKARLEELAGLPELFDYPKFAALLQRFGLTKRWETIQQWMTN